MLKFEVHIIVIFSIMLAIAVFLFGTHEILQGDSPNGLKVKDLQVNCNGVIVRYTVRDKSDILDVDTVCDFVNKWKKGE